MKNTLILLLTIFSIFLNAQSPVGAWERIHSSEDGTELKSIVIFSESHQSLSIIEKNTGKLIHSNGGSWKLEGNTVTEVVEFDTDNPERVGESVVFDININEEFLEIAGTDMKFSRIDNGSPGELNGAWLMSARFRNGKFQIRDTNKSRKTMKILSGSKFQWIAYDLDSKKFIATGGGSYKTINGKYSENIEYFSRDISRVGMKLEFDFNLKDGKWNHKGFSMKSRPIKFELHRQ